MTIDHSFFNRISIVSDNIKGIKELVTYVYEQGHRKIAYIHGSENTAVTQSRLTSFYNTLQEFGVSVPDEYIMSCPYRNTERAYEAAVRLLELKTPPTCILFPDDFAAFGGIKAIREKGLKPGIDISIVGYDGIEIARHITPRLTTIRQNTDEIGRTAAARLIDLINNPKGTLIEQITIEGILDKGESVCKI